jgi:hypothetical protein
MSRVPKDIDMPSVCDVTSIAQQQLRNDALESLKKYAKLALTLIPKAVTEDASVAPATFKLSAILRAEDLKDVSQEFINSLEHLNTVFCAVDAGVGDNLKNLLNEFKKFNDEADNIVKMDEGEVQAFMDSAVAALFAHESEFMEGLTGKPVDDKGVKARWK